MSKKYYTPDIDDVLVTGICVAGDGGTRSQLLSPEQIRILEQLLKDGNYKVPYLTKEQIEQEGWLVSAVDDFYNKISNRLTYDELSNELCIIQTPKITIDQARDWPEGKGNFNLFKGKCKSINEFRTLMKLLSIK